MIIEYIGLLLRQLMALCSKTLALATDNNADKMTALKIEGKTLIPPLEIAITKGDTGQLELPINLGSSCLIRNILSQ